MTTKAMESLMFTVGMVDKITKPLSGVKRAFNDVTVQAKRGFHDIQMGAIGLAAAGFAVAGALAPARDMYKAIGEVKSLGVAQNALDELQKTALAFSTQYGESAADFVRASYDIQSAIGGLASAELSSFTRASAILAKGTKSDIATITNYMGTMYGVYSKQAEKIGKANWVNQVAGQTAAAVQMFKTTGKEMADAASVMGKDAATVGVSMHEQMAILGTLQATTKSGSEAGTKYKAFLRGIAKAENVLGTKLTDAKGNALPIVEILEKIQAIYGKDINVQEGDALKKAFGSDEAVSFIKLLIGNTEGLAESIGKLGNIKGIGQAEKMAEAMVDPFDRAGASVKAIAMSFGLALLPAIQPVLSAFAKMAGWLVKLTQEYPLFTKIIGVTALAIAGVSASMALLTLTSGFMKSAFAGWILTQKALQGSLVLFKGVTWAVNAAMLANPVVWLVAGIAALIVGIASAIYWWEDLKAVLTDMSWIKAIGSFFGSMFDGIKQVFIDGINWLIDKVNWLPGVEIEKIGTQPKAPETLEKTKKTENMPKGGISRQITNAVNKNQSTSVGNITINTNQPANAIKNELSILGG